MLSYGPAKSVDDNRRMTMRLLSFAVWALVSASAVFWLTRLLSQGAPAPAHAVTAGQSMSVASADLSRVLGSTRTQAPTAATPSEPAVSSRFKLVGVVASRVAQPDSGLALIAVDGKPPRPVGLGGVVDGSLVLLAVNHRRAELGPNGGQATVTLELPLAPEPNRGTRPVAGITAPVVPAAPPTVQAPVALPNAVPSQPGVENAAGQTAPPPLPPMPGAVPRNAPATR
jgi:general secretion pathway protein C